MTEISASDKVLVERLKVWKAWQPSGVVKITFVEYSAVQNIASIVIKQLKITKAGYWASN